MILTLLQYSDDSDDLYGGRRQARRRGGRYVSSLLLSLVIFLFLDRVQMRVVVIIVPGRVDEEERSEGRELMMVTGRMRATHAQPEDDESISGRENV